MRQLFSTAIHHDYVFAFHHVDRAGPRLHHLAASFNLPNFRTGTVFSFGARADEVEDFRVLKVSVALAAGSAHGRRNQSGW